MYFNDVSLRSRPTKPGETVSIFNIKRLEVDVGLLALLGRKASVDLDLTIGNAKDGYGHIAGNITLPKFGKAGVELDLDGTDLPASSLPLRGRSGCR